MQIGFKKYLEKMTVNFFFKSGPKLGNILCKCNKTQVPISRKKGIYMYTCSCSPTAKYVGETRVSIDARKKQHFDDVTSTKVNVSGLSKHVRECTNGSVDWDDPIILATFNDKEKATLQRNLVVRESLEIRRQGSLKNNGLNKKDEWKCVKSNAWDPLLVRLGK